MLHRRALSTMYDLKEEEALTPITLDQSIDNTTSSSTVFMRRKRQAVKRLKSTRKNYLFYLGLLTSLWLIITLIRRSRTIISSDSFQVSKLTFPVHHEELLINYVNHPISSFRPRNQFLGTLPEDYLPVIVIVTATQNPRPKIILETYESLRQQSLQAFMWIIIDDYSTSSVSLEALDQINEDPRVILIKNPGNPGLPSARNVGLEYALTLDELPPYLMLVDDDDLLELTAIEKVVWMLESNNHWDIGGFPYIKFGAQNTTEARGLHSGSANYFLGNFVPNTAVIRTSALLHSGCWYDAEEFTSGGEDWDFWMCLAEKGSWGGTIPEFLYWYRINETPFRTQRWGSLFVDGFEKLKTKVLAKHSALATPGRFPTMAPKRSIQLEPVSWLPPYDSTIQRNGKAIMFVLPWLYIGGADIGALHMIQLYAEAGYRVTVVCTLHKKPAGIELRPFVLQYTHDVHILPSFLRANDFPRYIKHLLVSRNIDQVITSNSQYLYELLPALSDELPHIQFIDYLHNEAYDGWKSGGYPNYSVISQRYLARTITCSSYLRDWAIEKGHNPDRIGVVKLGIEISDFHPVNETVKISAKEELLGVEPDVTVITIVARLDPQKRSTLVPDIADKLRALGGKDFIIIMLGDGDLSIPLNNRIDLLKVSSYVWPLGTVNHPQEYLAATDIFLLPSLSEGISIAVAEAMAMGLPIVTARAGALPEQLGETKDNLNNLAGVLVNHTLVASVDAELYATELYTLLTKPELRIKLGQTARQTIADTFNWRETLQGLFLELSHAKNLNAEERKGLPSPAAYYASQTLLMEAAGETDFGINYL